MICQNVYTQLATIDSWLKFFILHTITHDQERMRVLDVQWVSISTFFVFQATLFDSCVCAGVILMLLTVDTCMLLAELLIKYNCIS